MRQIAQRAPERRRIRSVPTQDHESRGSKRTPVICKRRNVAGQTEHATRVHFGIRRQGRTSSRFTTPGLSMTLKNSSKYSSTLRTSRSGRSGTARTAAYIESFAVRKRARTPARRLSGWQNPRYTRWRTDWILSCGGGEAYGAFTAPEKSKSYGTASSGRGSATG